MTAILAIDPGNRESAYCLINAATFRPVEFGKTSNEVMRSYLLTSTEADRIVVEMIASYGMAVGADVFETCVWIGRFVECVVGFRPAVRPELVKRHPVKMHLCHSSKASDANIRQALVDRFAEGYSNHGKGTKANPGPFYGFAADVWAAYALAVYSADTS